MAAFECGLVSTSTGNEWPHLRSTDIQSYIAAGSVCASTPHRCVLISFLMAISESSRVAVVLHSAAETGLLEIWARTACYLRNNFSSWLSICVAVLPMRDKNVESRRAEHRVMSAARKRNGRETRSALSVRSRVRRRLAQVDSTRYCHRQPLHYVHIV